MFLAELGSADACHLPVPMPIEGVGRNRRGGSNRSEAGPGHRLQLAATVLSR